MRLSKKERQTVWNKSEGVCWYCGDNLPEKGWHADHVTPIIRDQNGEAEYPEDHHLDNIVPACAPCNLFKATFSVEGFRREIQEQVSRARRQSVNFRTAERFGLIEVSQEQVVKFWFESQKPVPPVRGE